MSNEKPGGFAALSSRAVIEARTKQAIEDGDFDSYQLTIMHDWLRTLTLLASLLVPVFFVLDLVMMPASLLPRFALYRGISTVISLIQLIIVRSTKPSRASYLQGYLMSLQVGGAIALMTVDLGGFVSTYYAGLNLVIMGVNLLMPWKARHTAANAAFIIILYVALNLRPGLEPVAMINNLFFLSAMAILATAVTFVRTSLVQREFKNLVVLAEARDALQKEKKLVEDRERSLTSLLDLSGEGFLSFDRNYAVQGEYSKECVRIFGLDPAGERIDELLFDDKDEASRAAFRSGLELYFSGQSRPEVIFDLLEHQLKIDEKTVEIGYRALSADRVMIVLSDITEELRLQEESRRENEKWNLLLKVISNRAYFASFEREAEELFNEAKAFSHGYDGFLRDLHSLKGNAGFLGLIKTAAAAHALEDHIADRVTLGQAIEPTEPLAALHEAYEQERAVVAETLGKEWSTEAQSIELKRDEYLRLLDYLKASCQDESIVEMVERHRRRPLVDLLERYPVMVAELATRMGKRIAPVEVRGGDIPVVADEFEDLIASFSHIVRNMVDHGVEPPLERQALGKDPVARIGIDIERSDGELVFTFSDDGRGIALPKVRQRAEEMGLLRPGEEPPVSELMALLFRDGFSTAESVTQISGRGVGLPAVREAVQRMKGRIKVKSTAEKGTVFTIEVPLEPIGTEEPQ